jgi:hypothetical protein
MLLANHEFDGANIGALVSAQRDAIRGRGDCCASVDAQIGSALNSGFRIKSESGERIGKGVRSERTGEGSL